MAIGAPSNAGGGSGRGHVRVYKFVSGTWTLQGADIDGEANNDQSGSSVSLSSDGAVVAIGALSNAGGGSYRGHVRVYKFVSSTWTLQGADIDGEADNDASGSSVSLSADGTTVAINAPYNAGGGSGRGHVRVFFNSTVLPVELLNFKGTPSVSGNVLTWQTASEVSNRGFEVERLVTDKVWQTLTFVKSKGAKGTYTFTDNTPLSTSYYRLKQVDNDGKFEYSKVISIAQTSKGKGLSVYPNPVSNILNLNYTEGSDFQILNLLGQQVLTGKTAQRLDVSALPQGTYVLKVGAEQVKFIKQ